MSLPSPRPDGPTNPSTTMRASFRLAASAAALAFLGASPASAQFGDALKRGARRAAERAAGDRVAAAAPATSADALAPATYGGPLTADTLALVLRGLEAEKPLLQRRDAAAERRLEIERQRSELRHSSMDVVDRYRANKSKQEQCSRDVMDKLEDDRGKIADARAKALAADPIAAKRFQDEMMKFSLEAQQYLARGDTAGLMKAQNALYAKHLGIDMSGDSAAIRSKCGAEPAQPQPLVDDSLLTIRLDAANEEVRAIEDSMQVAGARASGLSAERFALARERLLVWKDRRATGAKGFSAEEKALLEGRRDEIDRALGI